MNVLVVNAGSSSLKYQLFDTKTSSVLSKGICERIGMEGGRIVHKQPGRPDHVRDIDMKNHAEATKILVQTITDPVLGCIRDMGEIEAVGHRIVHGGEHFTESVLVDGGVLDKLELCRDIAPLHTGAHIMGIRGCMAVMPDIPQVLVFDTAFHQTMPEEAYFYPIPYPMYEKYKIRRYGFHGTSHKYVSGEMIKLLDKPAAETKIVTCHLGNGSSITAVKGGRVLDTSMGFTPLDGVIMGSRCGSIDPAIVAFIMEKEGFTPAEMNEFMNKQCGFLGVSGLSSDCRDLTAAIAEGNRRALLPIKILGYQIKKYIGGYAAAMNGLDAVVFTAGIGENTPLVRELACQDMDYMGIDFDFELNRQLQHASEKVCLTKPGSRVKVYVIPTNEELVIASETERIVSGRRV